MAHNKHVEMVEWADHRAEIVEDDEGFRILLVEPMGKIPIRVWAKAYDAGVAMIVFDQVNAISTDDFMVHRREDPATMSYEIEGLPLRVMDPHPAFKEYLVEQVTEAEIDPLGKSRFVHLHTHTEYCLAPETRVCTADLAWKPIGEVEAGEQLVGFGEDLRAHRSRMQRATVTATKRVVRDCYRITLEDGTEIISSAEHGWVGLGTKGSTDRLGGEVRRYGGNGRRWIYTRDLQPGRTRLEVWARPWDDIPADLAREAAYLAGIADGEGWMHEGQISFGQNPGLVLDEMHRVCKALDYSITVDRVQSSKGRCRTFRLAGYEVALRFVAQCRPVRFIGRTDEIWVGRRSGGRYSKPVLVVGLEHLGDRETVAIQTSTATFVAEGFLSHNSTLDGLSTWAEIFETIQKDPHGGGAVGSADHGTCAGHPELQDLADKHGLKPIFGMEAYFVPNRHRRAESWLELDGVRVDPQHLTDAEKKKAEKKGDSQEARGEYTHLTLWAMTKDGLRNLWAMSTEAYRDGLYDGKPRLDWETLEKFNEGVICGTGCLRGPVADPIKKGNHDVARDNLVKLHAIFGDRLYIEIHANSLPEQVEVNKHLRQMCLDYQIPPLAAVDSHYSIPEHKVIHDTWVAMQTGKTLAEDTSMFQGNQEYHLKTTEEVVESLIRQGLDDQFIYEAMANTVEVAGRCNAKVGGEVTTPVFSKESKEHPDPIQRDVERLFEVCFANWERKIVGKRYSQQVYQDRFEREMRLLIDKGFCGYFLIVWDYVAWAKSEGCLVGPGRGSGGGSLVAYLADIVEIDPVDSELIFERFLTEGRTSLPDFDIDFPASWRGRILQYLRDRWGEDYVSNIGTVSRLRAKQAINDVVRVMTPVLPYDVPFKDFDVLKKAVEEADRTLAGKHLPWEEFCAQYSDLVDPMTAAYPEIFAVVDVVMDRVKTYGKHAAGVVISTSDPLTNLPMRLVVDAKTKTEVMVTQFDMNALELLGYVKFDILTLRTLDTIQAAADLIREKYQVEVNPYDWKSEYDDPQVWGEVSAGRTLGLFQIETASGTRLTKRMQPRNLFDLAAVMTVVRPGPMRSGLTESYFRRRAGIERIVYPDPRLESFLGDTYGSMIYQEQVMATCMNLAGYDSTQADVVRKLLGKKQVEKVKAAGEEFVRRAVECGTQQDVADELWRQMAEFAKYGFNKAHAFAYAVLGYWCAFLRFHYPVEFLVAALSTVDADRIPEFVEDCRRNGYTIVGPDVNRSKAAFASDGIDVIYGLAEVKGIGEVPAEQIVSMAPFSSLDDFTERCVKFTGSKVNMGHLKTLVEVGAFDSLVSNRRAVEQQLALESSGEAKRCVFKVDGPGAAVAHHPEFPAPDVCTYQWENEQDPPMIRKRVDGKMASVPKPPPKKCTISCRNYTKPEPIKASDMMPYSGEEIMRRERELLGVWISHSPFEMIPQDLLDDPRYATALEIEAGPMLGLDGTPSVWTGVSMVEGVKKRKDRNGNDYAFVSLNMQDGEIEAICFASIWDKVGNQVVKDRIGGAQIKKTPRGYQLIDYTALN